MSHTVKQKSSCTDLKVLELACKRLNAELLGDGKHDLYDGSRRGIGIKLPGWHFPIVIQKDGEIAYDDFKGQWGDARDLKKLKHAYAVSAAYVAYGEGASIVETALDNGQTKVEIVLGGGSLATGGGGQVTGPGGVVLG